MHLPYKLPLVLLFILLASLGGSAHKAVGTVINLAGTNAPEFVVPLSPPHQAETPMAQELQLIQAIALL